MFVSIFEVNLEYSLGGGKPHSFGNINLILSIFGYARQNADEFTFCAYLHEYFVVAGKAFSRCRCKNNE